MTITMEIKEFIKKFAKTFFRHSLSVYPSDKLSSLEDYHMESAYVFTGIVVFE